MNCPRCGAENRDEATFCTNCGHRLAEHPTATAEAAPVPQEGQGTGETANLTELSAPVPPPPAPPSPVSSRDSAARWPEAEAPSRLAPTKGRRRMALSLGGWAVAVVAIGAAVFLLLSRADVSSEVVQLRDRVDDQQQLLRARQTYIEGYREKNDDLEGKVDVCQKAARVSRDAYNEWIDLAASFGPVDASRSARNLLNVSEEWDRTTTECLAQ